MQGLMLIHALNENRGQNAPPKSMLKASFMQHDVKKKVSIEASIQTHKG